MAKHVKGSAIANASSYKLYLKDGTELATQTTNVSTGIDFDLSTISQLAAAGTYELGVKAISGDTTKFLDSLMSNIVSYTVAESGGEPDTTTPVGVDKVLLSNYRSETGTTLSNAAYETQAKDTHVTFFDIPINPSEVYYVSWGVRAWFLKSDKSPISTINFYNASDVGKAHYVKAPSDAAYMSVCISSTQNGYSLPDAYIQQATLSFTATSNQLINGMTEVSAMQDNKGLNSASYIVEDKSDSWVYEYIPIVAGQSYRIEGGVRSWFLNSSKTSINTINLLQAAPKFTFIAPADAAYISVTFSNKQWTGEKDAVKIEEGTIDYTLK